MLVPYLKAHYGGGDDYPNPENPAMIGQNVPVNTAKVLCDNIVKALEGNIPFSGATMLMQNFLSANKPVKNCFCQD